MDVELTARQVRISKALREQAEVGMERIARLMGRTTSASVTFRVERHLQIAELTVSARHHTIAATGQAATQEAALKHALAHAEHQALRHRDKRLTGKRLPKDEKLLTAPPVARTKTRPPEPELSAETLENGLPAKSAAKPRASILAHSFPAKPTVVEPHIVKSSEAIALRPMSLEEAVKEAEFRDRELLIFHDPAGKLFVLHRRRDGQMGLVEIP
ncbi:HPF/RaiA family ribosome-associated protein [Terracidiphilus sp.]|jgi:putative sigma-54 modulation protein|uniref:HPF/RaiA family ribosome-associated protein n=1 Tax=Terracidiphilus sp. TaxID=1964191 RepID=UPI003C1627FC